MTRSDVLRLFEEVNCAQLEDGFAPHKPIVILLLLEMVAAGHRNLFSYREFDGTLRRLLERYGSPSAPAARSEPFWRLKNDGILHVVSPYSLLVDTTRTPTPAQLIDSAAEAKIPDELYEALRLSPKLISDAAKIVAGKFLHDNVRQTILVEAAPQIAKRVRSYWWVSQNQTYNEEVHGDFMWSPKTNRDGGRNPYYEFMRAVAQGDVVLSFSASQIRALGIVKQPAVSSPKPTSFGRRGDQWLDDGWLVEVAFYELGLASVRPSDHMSIIAPTLPDRYSPISPNGLGRQQYLAPIPYEMAEAILALVGPIADAILEKAITVLVAEERRLDEDDALAKVAARADLGTTEKEQIILARRGQGLFRTGVYQVEPRCRLTGVDEKIHLIASHIKPWKHSNDEERLSPNNGLLLSPHADHLFDGGYLSFEDNGKILVSRHLDTTILRKWYINSNANVGTFNTEQRRFLEYHRDAVLMR